MAQEKAAGSDSCWASPSYFPEPVRSENFLPGCPFGGMRAEHMAASPGSAPRLSLHRLPRGLLASPSAGLTSTKLQPGEGRRLLGLNVSRFSPARPPSFAQARHLWKGAKAMGLCPRVRYVWQLIVQRRRSKLAKTWHWQINISSES